MCTSVMPPPINHEDPTIENIIIEINKYSKADSFTITGGEPTLRSDIIEILTYINLHCPGSKINFITNARMLYYESFLNKFRNLKNFKIITELHADSASLHDNITGVKGSFEQAFGGIKNSLRKGFHVEFRIVISKLNYTNTPRIAEMIVKEFFDVESVVIFPIDLIGNAYVNKNEVSVRYDQFIPFLEQVCDILKQNKIHTILYHIPYCVINKKYYNLIKKGITVLEKRVVLADICKGCKFEIDCSRVWKSYVKQNGTLEFGALN